jgi:thiaminase
VAFITNRLSLSPDQATKFWPLYNEYQEKRNTMMREMRQISKQGEKEITNAEAEELIDKMFKLKENLLLAEKNFTKKIASSLSPIQALKLDEINRDFTRHIYRMHRKQRASRLENENQNNP